MVDLSGRVLTRLPWRTRLGFICGHIFNDLCASMWFSYLVLYFNFVLEFSHPMAGAIMLLGQVADALSTPFVGRESDKSARLCGKYGKRKGWHLAGTVFVAVSFPFVFSQCLPCGDEENYFTSDSGKFLYYAPFIVIFQFGWAAVQISHLCLIPELTSCAEERTWLNSGRVAMTVVANILVYVAMWQLFSYKCQTCEFGPEDLYIFRAAALGVVGVGLSFAILFQFSVREKRSRCDRSPEERESSRVKGHVEEEGEDRRENRRGSRIEDSLSLSGSFGVALMSWKDWFKEPQYYQVAALYMLTRLIYNVSQVFIPLYVTKSLKLEKIHVALVPLTVFFSGFVTTTVTKPVSQRIGRKWTYVIGLAFVAGFCGYLNWPEIGLNVYGSVVLLGIGSSTILVASLSITAELIGKNTECSGFVFGSMSFCDKLSNGLAVQLIELFVPSDIDHCDDCAFYYRDVLVFGVGAFALLAFVIILILMPQTLGERRLVGVSVNASSDASDPTRPLIPCSSSGAGDDPTYGAIDSHPPPSTPSMIRRPLASECSASSDHRSTTPTDEALHTAFTENALVGSYDAVKTPVN